MSGAALNRKAWPTIFVVLGDPMKRAVLILLILSLTACGNSRSKRAKSNSDNNANNTSNQTNNGVNNTNGPAVCGNGEVESGEACDSGIEDEAGACPTQCAAPACSTATLSGSASDCTAVCTVEPVGCMDGDGCCSVGCDANSDSDCTNICGDGVVEENELCDSNCPTACGSPNACTQVELQGDPSTCSSRCVEQLVEVCQGGDGCCPASCNANNDSDCGASCGNGTLEPGESCDGDCPMSCDDGVVCTRDTRAGSSDTCNVVCINEEIRVCTSGDGCCPVGCTNSNDSDCSATCGNGTIDAGETCDGNCPTSCSDGNVCTRDMIRGAASTCNVECSYAPINVCQGGDGCCPNGCTNLNDSDCQCTPSTCQQLGVMCGPADNGCGGTLQCGTCTDGSCTNGMCDTGGVTSTVGSPCTNDTDCAADTVNTNPYCITAAQGYPGGYCSAACMLVCNDFISPCLGAPLVGGECHQSCASQADCRTGYVCETFDHPFLGMVSACIPN